VALANPPFDLGLTFSYMLFYGLLAPDTHTQVGHNIINVIVDGHEKARPQKTFFHKATGGKSD
jgi:hypothetical protein